MLVRAKFNEAKCRGAWVIVVTVKQKRNLRDNAKNNTIVSTQTVIMAVQLSTVTKQHWNEHFAYTACQFSCTIMHHIIYQWAFFQQHYCVLGQLSVIPRLHDDTNIKKHQASVKQTLSKYKAYIKHSLHEANIEQTSSN